MADELAPAPLPGTTPAAPAAPPPAPVVAAAPPVAAASGAPAAPKKPVPPKAPANPPPLDQHPGFRKRLDQETRRALRKKFEVESDEEVEAILEAAKAARGGAPAAPAAAAAGSDVEKERLRKQNRKLARIADERKKKLISAKRRSRDEIVDLELRNDALRAGVGDDHSEFAIDLYKKAARAAAEVDVNTIPDSGPFFAGLRAKHPYIFAGAAPLPPVVLNPTTSPPESLQPGGTLPNQAPTGTRPPQLNVDERDEKGDYKMSDRDFKGHLSRYGVRLGG